MMEIYHSFSTPLQKSIFLDALRAANETLFFRMLMDNVDELLPVVYTPTEFDEGLNYAGDHFLGDPDEIARLMAAVANQGKKS